MTLSSKTEKLRSYLVLSDIHLGSRNTTAKEILKNLTDYFEDFSDSGRFTTIDVLFIAGDLFDDTIQFSSGVIGDFVAWFDRLLRWCSRNHVTLRILEGTPRHDRAQGATVVSLAELSKEPVDLRYIPALSIEHMEELGLTVLYVPDECRPTAEAVERDVEQLFLEHRVDKVDIAIMHGMFKYQLGTIPMNAKVHDEAFYLDRVRNYISIGHVHQHSQFSRIVAQGSFDRLSHGDEAAKGGVLIKEIKPGEWAHFFIENPGAKIYKTVEVKGDLERCLSKIDKVVGALPNDAHVRIQALSTHPIFQGFETLKKKYPLLHFTKKAVAKEEEVTKVEEKEEQEYRPIILNRETITEAVFTDVTQSCNLTQDEETRLYRLLEELHV